MGRYPNVCSEVILSGSAGGKVCSQLTDKQAMVQLHTAWRPSVYYRTETLCRGAELWQRLSTARCLRGKAVLKIKGKSIVKENNLAHQTQAL